MINLGDGFTFPGSGKNLKLSLFLRGAFVIPDGSVSKESACNAGDPGLIHGSGRSSGEGIGYPRQYSWASLVAQLVKNPPAMPETCVGSLGWKIPWRSERLPSLVFWPGEFHGLCSPWGCKEADMIKQLALSLFCELFREILLSPSHL